VADRHGVLGTYDLFADALLLFERGVHDRVTEPVRCNGLDDPKLPRLLPKAALAKLREEVGMTNGLCPPFDAQGYREGHQTPVYFGSALNNFAVRELLHGVGKLTWLELSVVVICSDDRDFVRRFDRED
jgi:peptide chain release factor 3